MVSKKYFPERTRAKWLSDDRIFSILKKRLESFSQKLMCSDVCLAEVNHTCGGAGQKRYQPVHVVTPAVTTCLKVWSRLFFKLFFMLKYIKMMFFLNYFLDQRIKMIQYIYKKNLEFWWNVVCPTMYQNDLKHIKKIILRKLNFDGAPISSLFSFPTNASHLYITCFDLGKSSSVASFWPFLFDMQSSFLLLEQKAGTVYVAITCALKEPTEIFLRLTTGDDDPGATSRSSLEMARKHALWNQQIECSVYDFIYIFYIISIKLNGDVPHRILNWFESVCLRGCFCVWSNHSKQDVWRS